MINTNNIDDIIRNEKKRLANENKDIKNYAFRWGIEGYKALRLFFGANMPGEHGWFCDYGFDEKEIDKYFKQGIEFMGIKHFWNKKRKGYELIKI